MNKIFSISIIIMLILSNCDRAKTTTEQEIYQQILINHQEEFSKLNKFLQKFDEPSQIFKIKTNKLITIKGKQGTIIHINPGDLETENGETVGKEIDIELKELCNHQQLLRANGQTISDGRLLVSGGAYYINASSNGQSLKLKTGKNYFVELPQLSVESMSLYYGKRNGFGQMNWKQVNKKFEPVIKKKTLSKKTHEIPTVSIISGFSQEDTSVIKSKVISEEEYQELQKENIRKIKVYKPIALNQFGWINCDQLYKSDLPIATVNYTIKNKAEEVNYVTVYLIFKDIRSVISSNYYVFNNKVEKEKFNQLPIGLSVRFLAVCYQHHKIYSTLTNTVKLKEHHNEELKLKEMSESNFDELLKKLN